jgi:diadenosine tetraphosphate (Ap4A) HIT family hydrolase
MNCSICTLLEGPITDRDVVAGNEAAVAWLHESRAHRGHSVVVARRHVENLSDLSDEEASGFLALARRVEHAALAETGSARAILMKLGLVVPHLHLHIYPFSREASRETVMKVIDGDVTDTSTSDERTAFAGRMRTRLTDGVGR